MLSCPFINEFPSVHLPFLVLLLDLFICFYFLHVLSPFYRPLLVSFVVLYSFHCSYSYLLLILMWCLFLIVLYCFYPFNYFCFCILLELFVLFFFLLSLFLFMTVPVSSLFLLLLVMTHIDSLSYLRLDFLVFDLTVKAFIFTLP